jgi:hypothetical protein
MVNMAAIGNLRHVGDTLQSLSGEEEAGLKG